MGFDMESPTYISLTYSWNYSKSYVDEIRDKVETIVSTSHDLKQSVTMVIMMLQYRLLMIL